MLLSLFALIGAVFAPQAVFAIEAPTPDTTITTPADPSTPDNEPENTTNSTPDDEEPNTCYDQVGAIGWLICPATSTSAGAIDSIKSMISNFLQVEPISTNQDSPIYLVWEYIRNITNIIFIIFIIVVIYSQLTGLGITNYGIKKVLPRIIIAAILVNLSYLICALVVDISNILGASFQSVFTNIQQMAIDNGSVSEVAHVSIVEFTAAIIGGAGIGGILAVNGILWMFIPILFAGLVSAVAAFVTLVARQALVMILIMIAPLAIVAYLLPNTEKWFKKWKDLLLQMLIFYPMFAVLFGASQLAGWAILASATSWYHVILGVAVQIIPLFFSLSLMKMSGTILGSIGKTITNLSAPAQNSVKGWATSQQQLSKQKLQANGRKYNPSAWLARRLADSKTRREEDTAILADHNKKRGKAYAAKILERRDGSPTRRAEMLGKIHHTNQQYDKAILRATNNLEEPMAHKARNAAQKRRLEQLDVLSDTASDNLKREQARSLDIALENLKGYERRTNEAIAAHARGEINAVYNQIASTAGIRGEAGINTIVANAIAAKAKARQEITGDYLSLFNEASYTANVDDFFKNAILSRNENAFAAADQVMIMRGDIDMIAEGLEKFTPELKAGTLDDRTMWKRMSDTNLPYKKEAIVLQQWSKCNNMARGKAEATRRDNEQYILDGHPERVVPEMPDYFDFADYMDPNGEAAKYDLDFTSLMKEVSEGDIAVTQDRTVFKYLKNKGVQGFTDKQLRAGIFSGMNEGERFQTMIDMVLGKDGNWTHDPNIIDPVEQKKAKKQRSMLKFKDTEALEKARERVVAMVKDAQAAQIAKFKSDSLILFSMIMGGDNELVRDIRNPSQKEAMLRDGVHKLAAHFRPTIIKDLQKRAAKGELDSLNPDVRQYLNDELHFER